MGKKKFKRSKFKEIIISNCPKCNSESLARFFYGLPEFTDDLKRKIDEKKVILGGCEIMIDNPVYHCNDCEYEF